MDRAGAVFLDGGIMLRCSITLVLGKTVSRVNFVKALHHAITCHFGEHTRGRDGITPSIPLNQCGLRIGQPTDSQPVD